MYDLVILGGGSGGLTAATLAARVGARVALIEKNKLGGECTHTACVPSKALIEAARLAHAIRHAGDYGIKSGPPEVDFPAVMARVRKVVEHFAEHDSAARLRAKGVDVYHGSAHFLAYDTVVLDGLRIVGKRFLLATGSRPAIPDIPGLDRLDFLDNESIWGLTAVPTSLAILGGGPVGIEFAQAFARLGSDVTVVDRNDRILTAEDPEASRFIRSALESEGIRFVLDADVREVERPGDEPVLLAVDKETGTTKRIPAARVLVAAGRLANVEGLNLEAAGIHADATRGISVDDSLRTVTRNIYAVGDVIGRDRWTHAAGHEAAVAFINAILRLPAKANRASMPRATFTDPEVASVGLTEADAVDRGLAHRVFRVEMSKVDRMVIDGQAAGFAKVVVGAGGKILGATIVGREASTVIQPLVMAMGLKLSIGKLSGPIAIYPAHSAVVSALAAQYAASRLEGGFVRTALRVFYGFKPRPAPGS